MYDDGDGDDGGKWWQPMVLYVDDNDVTDCGDARLDGGWRLPLLPWSFLDDDVRGHDHRDELMLPLVELLHLLLLLQLLPRLLLYDVSGVM